jgi:hypothetical protein
MGLRFLLLACRRVLVGIGALTLVTLPHVRPQMSSAQFQQIQQQQQMAIQNEWTTSHWDLGQNIRLDAIDTHLAATDTRIETLRSKHEDLAREVSEGDGESKVWFGILGAGLLAVLGFAASNFLKIRDAERGKA